MNETELATQEDIDNDLVYWAKIFKATNWEDLKLLCSNNEAFKEVAQVMYKTNVQSQEKTYMEAHEKYLLDKQTLIHELQISNEKLSSMTAEVSSLTAENSSLNAEVSSLNAENSSLNAKNAQLLDLLKKNGMSEEQIAAYLSN